MTAVEADCRVRSPNELEGTKCCDNSGGRFQKKTRHALLGGMGTRAAGASGDQSYCKTLRLKNRSGSKMEFSGSARGLSLVWLWLRLLLLLNLGLVRRPLRRRARV